MRFHIPAFRVRQEMQKKFVFYFFMHGEQFLKLELLNNESCNIDYWKTI